MADPLVCPECGGTVWTLDVLVDCSLIIDTAAPDEGPELSHEIEPVMAELAACSSCGFDPEGYEMTGYDDLAPLVRGVLVSGSFVVVIPGHEQTPE